MDYEDSLDRALAETPDIEGSGERFELPDPELRGEGNVTVFENFQTVVERVDRREDHVLKFIQDELGTSAHIDESGRARFTGDFGEGRVGRVLESYLEAYVTCPECGLPDTSLETEQGATLIRCSACGARSPAGD